jgi:hypothetical protein
MDMKKVFIVADYRMLLGDSSVEVFTDINKALQEFNRERKALKEYAKTYSGEIFEDYLKHTEDYVEGEIYLDVFDQYTRVVISTHEI